MVSKLEDALLRCRLAKGAFRKTLFQYLDDDITLRRLRTVSRALHDLVDHFPERAFGKLYVQTSLTDAEDTRRLAVLAPFCHTLTVKVGYSEPTLDLKSRRSFGTTTNGYSEEYPRRSQGFVQSLWRKLNQAKQDLDSPTGSNRTSTPLLRQSFLSVNSITTRASVPPAQLTHFERRQQDEERREWIDLLSRFRHVTTLNLRVNGDTAWPGRTGVEEMLLTLRIAIEHAKLPELRTFCCTPLHVMGIIHLCWRGSAFGESLGSRAAVWQQIETLDLRIRSPFATGKLTEPQQVMFLKLLHGYLTSFAPTLRCLRLVWLDGDGPSPLTLHTEPGLKDRGPMLWPKLEELWVGNITLPHQTIEIAPDLAPKCSRLKTLCSTRRHSSVRASDSSAWVEILLGVDRSSVNGVVSRASSIYSQSAKTESVWAGGISRSSRVVPFMLDI